MSEDQAGAGNEELAAMAAARRRSLLIAAGVLAVGLTAFGLFTWALGVGPFAWRVFAYGRGELYILNVTDAPVWVTLDGGEPLEVPSRDARRTPLNGGTTRVETRRADGSLLEELEVFVDGAPMVYNVEGATCMALSDVSSFYLPKGERSTRVIATYPRGTRSIPLPSDRVIWPRKTLQDEILNATEGVHWIEMVACPLIDPQEELVLEAHLNTLLTERKRKEQEEELKRKMLREGGDAVDRELLPELERLRAASASSAPASSAPPAGEIDGGL